MEQVFSNRRRCVRQRVHSPAYASVTPDSSQPAFRVGEISDISSEGLSFHCPRQFTPGDDLHVRLNVAGSDTPIEAEATVAWADASGRTGVRLRKIPATDRQRLEQWLFANLLAASFHYLSSRSAAAAAASAGAAPAIGSSEPVPDSSEYATILITLAAIRSQADAAGTDLDRVLEILVEHARTVTCASGAAIAISSGRDMICRASSGPSAPPVHTRLGVDSGFSGECVRRGQLLRCNDSETDPVVDRESCQALGVRSLMAAPVLYSNQVVGLIEVFSPHPQGFHWKDEVYLRRLAEMILVALRRALSSVTEGAKALRAAAVNADVAPPNPLGFSGTVKANASESDGDGPDDSAADPISEAHASRFRNFSYAAVAALAVILAAAFAPAIRSRMVSPEKHPPRPAAKASLLPAAGGGNELSQLRTLAEKGDPSAQFSLGAHYAVGDEVPQDYREAARWFSLAADQGHVTAQATLGAYYWLGRGVPKDLDQAYYWSVLAKAGGDEASKYRVPALASQLSRSDVIADQEHANEWIREHQLASDNPRSSSRTRD